MSFEEAHRMIVAALDGAGVIIAGDDQGAAIGHRA